MWTTHSDSFPLQYTFGYLDDQGQLQTWGAQTDSEITQLVPEGFGEEHKLTLTVIVKDAFGSSAQAFITITSLPFDGQGVDDLYDEKVLEEAESGNWRKAVSASLGFMTVVNSNEKIQGKYMFVKQDKWECIIFKHSLLMI